MRSCNYFWPYPPSAAANKCTQQASESAPSSKERYLLKSTFFGAFRCDRSPAALSEEQDSRWSSCSYSKNSRHSCSLPDRPGRLLELLALRRMNSYQVAFWNCFRCAVWIIFHMASRPTFLMRQIAWSSLVSRTNLQKWKIGSRTIRLLDHHLLLLSRLSV